MVEALPAPSWTVGGEGDVPDDEPEVLLDVPEQETSISCSIETAPDSKTSQ